jgi:hypothetical protein
MSRRPSSTNCRCGGPLCLLLVVLCGFGGGVARGQVTTQTLVGKAVSDDSQSKEINNAIARFRDRDIDGCRAILERAKSNNAKLSPPGVMMATLWLSVNQLLPARAELEDAAVKFPGDPEPYLMLGDLAFQDRRVTDAAVLFEKATSLTAGFTENAKRKRDFEARWGVILSRNVSVSLRNHAKPLNGKIEWVSSKKRGGADKPLFRIRSVEFTTEEIESIIQLDDA